MSGSGRPIRTITYDPRITITDFFRVITIRFVSELVIVEEDHVTITDS